VRTGNGLVGGHLLLRYVSRVPEQVSGGDAYIVLGSDSDGH